METTNLLRPRCSVFIAVSLDGFIAREDDSLDWLDAVQTEGEDYGYARFMAEVDTLVVGRRTYETVLGFDSWPYSGKRCIVLSHTPREARHGEEFFAGDPVELAERLFREGAKRAYVDGGAAIRAFLHARLIDDLTLSVIPVTLGKGIPLFGAEIPEQTLKLEASRTFPSGLVQLTYRP